MSCCLIRPARCFSLLAALAGNAFASTYWVSPSGNDANPGTSNAPFATPQKAVTLAALAAGDTIYVRGGIYTLNTQVKPGKHGAEENYIKLWAYPGEQPVLDFAAMGGSDKALDVRRNYWHVRGLTVKNAPNNGIFVGFTGNLIEGCVVFDCKNDGIVLGSTTVRATNSWILNCDSYRNYQPGDGNNGDGFAAKDGCGPGNVFEGCRAWNNSDDGWDLYNNNESVTLINCWAFANGLNLWGYTGTWQGNGNGIKLGGAGTTGRHVVRRSLAFDNTSKGFDHNNGIGAHTLHHNTGFRNGKWNFSFYDQPVNGNHDFRNNLSYLGLGGTNYLITTSVQVSNSWPGWNVTAADFVSLDATLAVAPRNADYSLPDNGFLRLVAGSPLIDGGVEVGLPFHGGAPDLGAFEFAASLPPPVLQLFAPGWSNGGFTLHISGAVGPGHVVLLASDNFSAWTPLATNPVAAEVIFTDTPPTTAERRFYRARLQP